MIDFLIHTVVLVISLTGTRDYNFGLSRAMIHLFYHIEVHNRPSLYCSYVNKSCD